MVKKGAKQKKGYPKRRQTQKSDIKRRQTKKDYLEWRQKGAYEKKGLKGAQEKNERTKKMPCKIKLRKA